VFGINATDFWGITFLSQAFYKACIFNWGNIKFKLGYPDSVKGWYIFSVEV
jgi:hypothetical protein